MPNKTYGQLCPIARSLDVLGERWTLLVVRELLLGPKRFKDLLAVLPAMGTNRLSERLASLTADGIIRKSALPPPASISVHELTERGEQLRGPLMARTFAASAHNHQREQALKFELVIPICSAEKPTAIT